MALIKRYQNNGFSLVELLMGVSILILVMMSGVMVLQTFTKGTVSLQMETKANQKLQSMAERVRIEAVSNFQTMTDASLTSIFTSNNTIDPAIEITPTLDPVIHETRTRHVKLVARWREGIHQKSKQLEFDISPIRGKFMGGQILVAVANGKDGTPVPGIKVTAPSEGGTVDSQCDTQSDGLCILTNVRLGTGIEVTFDGKPGDFKVSNPTAFYFPNPDFPNNPNMLGASWTRKVTVTEEVTSHQPIQLAVQNLYPTGSIRGRVFDAAGGFFSSPVDESVKVALRTTSYDSLVINMGTSVEGDISTTLNDPATFADERGYFNFPNVIPGRYYLRVAGSRHYTGVDDPDSNTKIITDDFSVLSGEEFNQAPSNLDTIKRGSLAVTLVGLKNNMEVDTDPLQLFDLRVEYSDYELYYGGTRLTFNTSTVYKDFYNALPETNELFCDRYKHLFFEGNQLTQGLTSFLPPVVSKSPSNSMPYAEQGTFIGFFPAGTAHYPSAPILYAPRSESDLSLANGRYIIYPVRENGEWGLIAAPNNLGQSTNDNDFTSYLYPTKTLTTTYYTLEASAFGNVAGSIKEQGSGNNFDAAAHGAATAAVFTSPFKVGGVQLGFGMLEVLENGNTEIHDILRIPVGVTDHTYDFYDSTHIAGGGTVHFNRLPPNVGNDKTRIIYQAALPPVPVTVNFHLTLEGWAKTSDTDHLDVISSPPNDPVRVRVSAAGEDDDRTISFSAPSFSKLVPRTSMYEGSCASDVKVEPAQTVPCDIQVPLTTVKNFPRYFLLGLPNDNWYYWWGENNYTCSDPTDDLCSAGYHGTTIYFIRNVEIRASGHVYKNDNQTLLAGAKVTMELHNSRYKYYVYSGSNGYYSFQPGAPGVTMVDLYNNSEAPYDNHPIMVTPYNGITPEVQMTASASDPSGGSDSATMSTRAYSSDIANPLRTFTHDFLLHLTGTSDGSDL